MKQLLLTGALSLFCLIVNAKTYQAAAIPAPCIDGCIGQKEWQGAEFHDVFSILGHPEQKELPAQTKVWLGSDQENLYVAVRCLNKTGAKPRNFCRQSDGRIHDDDCVEIFLCGTAQGRTYLQLGQSAGGIRFDAEVTAGANGTDVTWTSALWRNAAKIHSGYFDAEFAIPLKLLPFDGSGILRFNVARTVRGGGNHYLSLVPMRGVTWKQPDYFARLTFPALESYARLAVIPPPELRPVRGINHFSCIIRNNCDRERKLNLIVQAPDERHECRLILAPGEQKRAETEWLCRQDTGSLSWSVNDADGKQLHVSPSRSFSLLPSECLLPRITLAGRKIPCRISMNYGISEIRKAKADILLKAAGQRDRRFSFRLTEDLLIPGLPAGVYAAAVSVLSSRQELMLKKQYELRIIENIIPTPNPTCIKDGQTLAFLGDSITRIGHDTTNGFIHLITEALASRDIGIRVIPAGIGGNTSRAMLARLERDILSGRPDWLILSCGVNDVWYGDKGIPLEEYRKNVTAMADRATRAGIRIILLTPSMIMEQPDGKFNANLKPYVRFIRNLAASRKMLLADINLDMHQYHKLNPDGPPLTYDGVHVNTAGHIMFASCILRTMGFPHRHLESLQKIWRK